LTVYINRENTRFGVGWDVYGIKGSDSLYFFVGDDPMDDEHIRTKAYFCGCLSCRIFDYYNCCATEFTGKMVSHTIAYKNAASAKVKKSEVDARRLEIARSIKEGDAVVLGTDRFEKVEGGARFWLAIADEKPKKATKLLGLADGAVKQIKKNALYLRIRHWLAGDAADPLKFDPEVFPDLPGWEEDITKRAPRILSFDAVQLIKLELSEHHNETGPSTFFLSSSDREALLRMNWSRFDAMM
jgi:hypothetical protein